MNVLTLRIIMKHSTVHDYSFCDLFAERNFSIIFILLVNFGCLPVSGQSFSYGKIQSLQVFENSRLTGVQF